jgi:hypothetical protein
MGCGKSHRVFGLYNKGQRKDQGRIHQYFGMKIAFFLIEARIGTGSLQIPFFAAFGWDNVSQKDSWVHILRRKWPDNPAHCTHKISEMKG